MRSCSGHSLQKFQTLLFQFSHSISKDRQPPNHPAQRQKGKEREKTCRSRPSRRFLHVKVQPKDTLFVCLVLPFLPISPAHRPLLRPVPANPASHSSKLGATGATSLGEGSTSPWRLPGHPSLHRGTKQVLRSALLCCAAHAVLPQDTLR